MIVEKIRRRLAKKKTFNFSHLNFSVGNGLKNAPPFIGIRFVSVCISNIKFFRLQASQYLEILHPRVTKTK